MNEEKNNMQNQNLPTGFDSVSKVDNTENDESKFVPHPMFAGMNQKNNSGYTVTPEGGFYTNPQNEDTENSIDKSETPVQTDDNSNSNAQSDSNLNENSNETDFQPQNTEPTDFTLNEKTNTEPSKPDFIPSGTYSYSAKNGDLPSSAYQKAEINPPKAQYEYITNEINADTAFAQSAPKKAKKQKNKKYGLGVVITSIVLSALIGAGGAVGTTYFMGGFTKNNQVSSSESNTNTAQNVTNITVDETVNSSIEAVAKKAGPSIIGIRTTAAVTSFFGGSSEESDEGSGIIYSSDGYIITNYHVIQSAVESSNSKVEVFLPDDTSTAITATIVGYNIASDLAVVKINKTGLTAINFADSEKLSVGQYAIAIGNPGGLEFIGSVSYGVISGLNRSVTVGTGSTMSLIQTDAAINPGNSGGALVNIKGELIGVNSVKLVSASYEGMGFAIPSNTVKEICDSIIEKQNDPTPYIGIQISQSYTASQLQALGYPAGAVVVSVIEGGPASESGIQRGDIITEFNGTTISSHTDLDNAISNCKPGNSVTVKLYRAGRFYSTNINVEANNAQ